MASLSRVLGLINDNFETDEDKDDVFKRFKDLVHENGLHQIYVVEFNPDYITFDMMGESTDWDSFFESHKHLFKPYTSEEHFDEGLFFRKNVIFAVIDSLS